MESKFLVYRISALTGRRDYKVAKCSYSWCISSRDCWRFSFKGAKSIADRLNLLSRGFYIYGFEQVFD